MKLKSLAEYGIVQHGKLCLSQRSPLSRWWGGFTGQYSSFTPEGGYYVYNCTEQWMMVAKAAMMSDEEIMSKIMATNNPSNQRTLGRRIKNFNAALWDKHKEKAVYLGNLFKFKQNPELKEFLLSFPRHTIFAEAAPWDSVWGIGLSPTDSDSLDQSKWKGQNLLGKAIQRVHRELY